MVAQKKKKKVSKKSKRAWRKHTDVEDVENFLEEKRADQRLGVDKLSSRKDAELFAVDVEGDDPLKKGKGRGRTKAERKVWAQEPSRYQSSLIPLSSVEDPIKRNRVRTKEERKHPARKAKDAELFAKGTLRQKARQAIENNKLSLKNNKKQRIKQRKHDFLKNIWTDENTSKVDDKWLDGDNRKHALIAAGEFKVKPPRDLYLPRSTLSKIETPHPGLSYNPSFADHKELLDRVKEKEVKMIKQDAHIARVTAPFNQRKYRQSNWVEEVLRDLGIGKEEEKVEIKEDVEEEKDDKAGADVKKSTPKMKTKKQRKAKKRLRREAEERKHIAVEKRKITDILKVKGIVSDLETKEARSEKMSKARRETFLEHSRSGTKRLARLKFEELPEDFTSSGDLTGSLRKLRAKQTLLRDRFISMQKRNLLQPTTRIFKGKKRKVKVVIKRDHRIEEAQPLKKTSNKIKVIDNAA